MPIGAVLGRKVELEQIDATSAVSETQFRAVGTVFGALRFLLSSEGCIVVLISF